MLLKRHILSAIAAGRVTLAFRRWRRPTVKAGGTLRTEVGVLAIEAVEPVDLNSITPREAAQAGADSLAELVGNLRDHQGQVYRIRLKLAGADPRISLREEDDLSGEDLAEIADRLGRLDRASRRGPWTLKFLLLLDQMPARRAADLAAEAKMDPLKLKNDVRKLKNLGLTISLHPGYHLSPRGRRMLAHLRASSV